MAPTGTLSMIASCSNGMEPTFAIAYEKRVTVGKFLYGNKWAMQAINDHGLNGDDMLAKIDANGGSVIGIQGIPQWMQKVFVTAMDIHWSDHLMAQHVWQQWIGNAIAKTINMPNESQPEDVGATYLLAHEMGLKGITVYRDGSRHKQVLHLAGNGAAARKAEPSQSVLEFVHNRVTNRYVLDRIGDPLDIEKETDSLQEAASREPGDTKQQANPSQHTKCGKDHDGSKNIDKCPQCNIPLVLSEGCGLCIECGYSRCSA